MLPRRCCRRIDARDLRLAAHQALVVLNSCHGGRRGVSLTGLGGLAPQFLEAGAGAVIGAQFSIGDRQAAAFAAAFYRLLLSGSPVGEALRQSRLELRARFGDDPSWLSLAASRIRSRAGNRRDLKLVLLRSGAGPPVGLVAPSEFDGEVNASETPPKAHALGEIHAPSLALIWHSANCPKVLSGVRVVP